MQMNGEDLCLTVEEDGDFLQQTLEGEGQLVFLEDQAVRLRRTDLISLRKMTAGIISLRGKYGSRDVGHPHGVYRSRHAGHLIQILVMKRGGDVMRRAGIGVEREIVIMRMIDNRVEKEVFLTEVIAITNKEV